PVLYVETPAGDRRGELAWPWVTRLSLKNLKSKLSVQRESLAWLEERETADETVLQTWPALTQWQQPGPQPLSPKQWLEAIDLLAAVPEASSRLLGASGWEPAWFADTVRAFKNEALSGRKYVQSVSLDMLVGLVRT